MHDTYKHARTHNAFVRRSTARSPPQCLLSAASSPCWCWCSSPSSSTPPTRGARRAVGLRPLAWDERLASYARGYAAERAGAGADCALVHSHGPYGENLFHGSGGGWSPAAVVAAWVVRERAMYDLGSNTCGGGASPGACGHYTQIVWRDTTAVGCAAATCAGGRGTFAVCVYNPPGNYVGTRPY